MPRKRVPVDLRPARIRSVKREHLPVLPEWYPLDPKDGPRHTEAQRRELREQRQMLEATRGPYDGQRGLVADFATEAGPPAVFVPLGVAEVRYLLDPIDTRPHQLVYRYDVDSPVHADAMRAVEDAYRQQGQDYAVTAREEQTHEDDRTAPAELLAPAPAGPVTGWHELD